MGRKTTVREVITTYGSNLQKRTALITGCNSGIGLELCKELVNAGCRVIAGLRDEGGGKAIRNAMSSVDIEANDLLDVRKCDLNSLASVQEFSHSVTTDYKELDFVVYNAGIMATPTLQFTQDGFEKQIGINHFGHAYLNSLLYDTICNQDKKCRVITLSSTAHAFGKIELDNLNFDTGRTYTPWSAYGQSKLANLLFAKGLAKKLKRDGCDSHVTSMSVHPGVIRTNLWRSTPVRYLGPFTDFIGFMDKSVQQGASTSAWAMLSPRIDREATSFQGAYLSDCAAAKPINSLATDDKFCDDFWSVTQEQLCKALER